MLHTTISSLLLFALLICSRHDEAGAFTTYHPTRHPHSSRRPYINTERYAQRTWTARERNAILGRAGEYFELDRMRGKIAFGSSSRILTPLDGSDESSVKDWLSRDKQIAMSIWDPQLITEVGPKVYRLKLMTLMFVY